MPEVNILRVFYYKYNITCVAKTYRNTNKEILSLLVKINLSCREILLMAKFYSSEI